MHITYTSQEAATKKKAKNSDPKYILLFIIL